MAEEHKKSFMLYFDAYPSIAALPAEQRGELLVLLYRYAMAAEKAPTDPEEILAQFPDLAGETQMAYRFLAQAIRRTQKSGRPSSGVIRRQRSAVRRRAGGNPAHRTGMTSAG